MSEFNKNINMTRILDQTNAQGAIYRKLTNLARDIGVESFRKNAVGEIINRTQPDRVIPDVYKPYRALVRDGIQFFLSHLSYQRLLNVIVHQLQMNSGSDTEERLIELAKQFPTLHKLGQIIARNKNIDHRIKRWLIQLENGNYGTAADELLAHIGGRLNQRDDQHHVSIDPFILSEASVGAVIPFKWTATDSSESVHGVFKVLKPNIRANLEEELAIFEKMATFFEKNRHRYVLKNLNFLHVFEDVRNILLKEINLQNEQSHLREASRVFKDMDGIVIPNVIPFSDETMTAMAFIDGEKITDVDLTDAQRKTCAHILIDSLICRPLFSTDETALFHGDPHAGNILLVADRLSRSVKVALLDWSLAGHLTQKVRIQIVRLIQGILISDLSSICRSLQHLAKEIPEEGPLSRSSLRSIISVLIQSEDYSRFSLIKKSFWLLEQLSYEGVVFPPDLMLFRKALFTLEGVLFDLHPQFNMDTFLFKYMAGLLADEIPLRIFNLFFPLVDKPENYRSLLSNGDLHTIIMHQYTATLKRNTNAIFELFEEQALFMSHFSYQLVKQL